MEYIELIFFYFLIGCKFYFISIESIIHSPFTPIIITQNTSANNSEYLLKLDNEHLTLVLTKKLNSYYPINIGVNGEIQKDINRNINCFYEGYIREDENSYAIMNICDGLNGIIRYKNLTLSLTQYKDIDINNKHFHKFQSASNETKLYNCKEPKKIKNANQKIIKARNISPSNYVQNITKTLKLSIVVPYELFTSEKYCSGSISKTVDWVTNIVYLSNFYYRQINIIPLLMHMEIYTKPNLFPVINISTDDETMLNNSIFARYILYNKSLAFDVTILLSPHSHGSTTGYAYVGTICNEEWSSGFVSANNNFLMVATFSHEIGHIFGCIHANDRQDNRICSCNGHCLMNSFAYPEDFKKLSWSNCDKEDITATIDVKGQCLYELPKSIPLNPSYCGNGILEEGEDCDCGLPHICAEKEFGKCCDAMTCKFTPGSNCASGTCCVNCQISKLNQQCFNNIQNCIIGFCDGKTTKCTINKFAEDNTPCNNGNGYCFKSICLPLISQCQQLFGTKSVKAQTKCWKYFNSQANVYGNCGYLGNNLSIFKPCKLEDIFCGKLVCENYNSNLNSAYNYSKFQNRCIVTFDPKYYNEFNNFGMVEDGAECGPNRVCLQQKCIEKEYFAENYILKKCGAHSIININNSCECIEGAYPKNKLCFLKRNNTSINVLVLMYGSFLFGSLLVIYHMHRKYNKNENSKYIMENNIDDSI